MAGLMTASFGACGGGDDDGNDGADASTTPDAPPGIDAAPPDAAGPPDAGVPQNCDSLSASPQVTLLPGFVGTEDITFDDVGNVLESDQVNIYKTTRQGMRKTFVPNLPFRAGMRMTRTGKLIVNDETTGTLWRIDPNGTRTPLMTGLQYPNGMEIGNDGYVYFTDQSSETVYRVDPETGAHTTMTTMVPQPNGLTFNTTYDKLYIGSFCGSQDRAIYQLEVGPGGVPGALSKYKTGVGSGCHDGMAVDACGNLYVADYGESIVYRISPSGEVKAILQGFGSYHANFDWGRGVGGWLSDRLYIVTVGEGIKEVELGVASKPRQ
jgi:hypothetical protein